MYPHERSLVKQLADKPFSLIGVNSDRNLEEIRKVVKEKELAWRSFQNQREGKSEIADDWGVTGWPTIYVLDDKGVIRFKNVRGAAMDQAIEQLLNEMGVEVTIAHEEEKKPEPEKPAASADSNKEESASDDDGTEGDNKEGENKNL